ncbi:MAG: hypothetical protein RIQ89_1310 [Bacteroidota bacterium]
MAIINSILSWWIKKRLHQIDLFLKYPHEVQQDWLTRLIQTSIGTEWGRKYGYGSINSVEDFKKNVPISNYDALKPYIMRIMQGEQNILWASEIKNFSKSSGTTADKSKFIPVSNEALEECHYKGGKDMLSVYCNLYPNTQIFSGKSLALGGSHVINSYNPDSIYGDISAILLEHLPYWAEFNRIPDRHIALLDKWETKIERMAEAAIKENVTNLSGVPTWIIVLSKKILEQTGKQHLLEVWPNLELYIHGAVNFNPYRSQFRKLIPSDHFHYLETYNASEGFFGIQDQKNTDEMLLMLDYGIYYEFMPMEEYGKDHPQTLTLKEVELGKSYAMVISTNAGLWRYIIGDTIKFTSIHPYRIKITGRTKLYINAFGEEVMIDNTDTAIQTACDKCNAMIKDYTVAPRYFEGQQSGAHEWIIEFEQAPSDLNYFTNVLDNALKSLNSDYEAKRYKDMALSLPIIHAARNGTFYQWMKQKQKLGGQHKVPRLSNDRKNIEELLAIKNGS